MAPAVACAVVAVALAAVLVEPEQRLAVAGSVAVVALVVLGLLAAALRG
jgi:hypothetical protein